MAKCELFVVMPTYNEEHAIEEVVVEWIQHLRTIKDLESFSLCVIDDGSLDATYRKLEQLTLLYSELVVVRAAHGGHSASCLQGYWVAIEVGAEWIFQIDSDGQCDPYDFQNVWRARQNHEVIFGFRRKRNDGVIRKLISGILSLEILLLCGLWIKDANVPFRLISSRQLIMNLKCIPVGTKWCNILSAILFAKTTQIKWIEISFLQRKFGQSKLNFYKLASCALLLPIDLLLTLNSWLFYSKKELSRR